MGKLSLKKKLKSLFLVTVSGIGAYGVISFLKNDQNFYRNTVMPLVHLLEPEKAHRLGILASKYRLIPKTSYSDPPSLKIKVFDKEFENPIGIAAGFDKHAEAILGLKDLGFGFIEVGSVTPEPQPGNPKPRVFRLPEDHAVVNRYGFNSDGHQVVFQRLTAFKSDKNCDRVVGVNLGKNKTSDDPINDYVLGVERLGSVADYLVVNVSSPNTPGLRSMQNKTVLRDLLKSVIKAKDSLPGCKPPVLLKLAPDLSLEEVRDIAEVVREKNSRIDGLIISNTTIMRPHFLSNQNAKNEVGGLSGKPLRDTSTKMISELYRLTQGEIPIIGVGGVFTGRDAYEKIKAGASLVQIYTSLVYEGPPVVAKIKEELAQLLDTDGYQNVAQAVGSSVK